MMTMLFIIGFFLCLFAVFTIFAFSFISTKIEIVGGRLSKLIALMVVHDVALKITAVNNDVYLVAHNPNNGQWAAQTMIENIPVTREGTTAHDAIDAVIQATEKLIQEKQKRNKMHGVN